MNKDTQLIWERFLYTEKDSIHRERKPQHNKFIYNLRDEHHEDGAEVIEKIYGAYNTPEEQKENILDFFNDWKPGGQAKIREILQRKMQSILRDDPQSDHAKMMMNIMVIIGQKI
jgi:hypothetical protein